MFIFIFSHYLFERIPLFNTPKRSPLAPVLMLDVVAKSQIRYFLVMTVLSAPNRLLSNSRVCVWTGPRLCSPTPTFLDVNLEMDVGLHGWGTTPVIPRYTVHDRAFGFQANFLYQTIGKRK